MITKNLKAILLFTIFSICVFCLSTQLYAKTNKTEEVKKNIVVVKGNKKHIKIKNAGKKVKWKIIKGKNKIKIIKKKGKKRNRITFLAKKEGKVVIKAAAGKKIYKYTITVKKSREKVNNEYQTTVVNNNGVVENNANTEPENGNNLKPKYATVHFETLKLAMVPDIYVEIGKPYGEQLPTPILAGHTFKGWLTKDGEKITADSICTGDITLYADAEIINGEIDVPGF